MAATADLSLSQLMKRAHRTPTIATGTTNEEEPSTTRNQNSEATSQRRTFQTGRTPTVTDKLQISPKNQNKCQNERYFSIILD